MRQKTRSEEETQDSPEVIRLAMRLQAEDQEREAEDAARKDALEELQVEEKYLEQARIRAKAREIAREARINNAIGITIASFVVIGLGLLLHSYINRPPAPAITETFSAGAARWNLDSNPESLARTEATDGTIRISVDRFRPSMAESTDLNYWATLRSIDGTKNVDRHSRLQLRARGEGLSRLRFRFVSGRDSWVTPALELSNSWKTYDISIAKLQRFRKSGDTYKDRGFDQLNRRIDEIQIQTGNHVNPITGKGWVELDEFTMR